MNEANFKASKKKKKKTKKNSKLGCICSDGLNEDEEMDNFIRKIKKGTSKYKGMLPLNVLIVVVLVILLLNVLIRINIVMKKKFLKGKINIKRETR